MRNYNDELIDTADHKYAYDFDVDVMHPYYMRAMKTFLKSGVSLEMGSYKGQFTKIYFEEHFKQLPRNYKYHVEYYDEDTQKRYCTPILTIVLDFFIVYE